MLKVIRMRWHKLGVQEKLHILIQGSLILVFFFFVDWVAERFEGQIMAAAEVRARETADGLINGMNMLMLTGQASDPANRMLLLNKMRQSEGVLELRIIRGHDVNQQYGPGLPEEAVVDALDEEVLQTGRPVLRRITAEGETRALRVVLPFIAQRDFRGTNCLTCHHTPEGRVNGAASVTIDLRAEEQALADIKRTLWLGHLAIQVVLSILIALFVRFVIVRNITRPVRRLQQTMAEIQRENDLSRRAEVDVENADIGEMAKTFNQLLESLQRANQRLDLFDRMFHNSGEAMVITDAERNIIAVNPAFEQITQYKAEEVLGKNPRILSSGKQTREFYKLMWDSINETGQWSGEIWNRRKDGEVYPEWLSIGVVKNARGEVLNYISLFTDITKRKEAEQRIEFLAHYDVLTRLPNRSLFNDRLKHALQRCKRNSCTVALMFLDLDHFKEINDTFGHQAGDLLLQSVAQRLRGCVREADTICRQGGDEFLILLEDLDEVGNVTRVADKIIEAMSMPHDIEGRELHVTFSIGAAFYPDDAEDAETLLRHADAAMYRAKQAGRNQFCFFRARS